MSLLIRFWKPIGLILVILATVAYVNVLRSERDAIRAEYAGFKAQVQAQGEAAEKVAKAKESADKKRKEQADAENTRLRTANAALNRSLRESRSASSFVPAAPSGSASPDRACFDRAELERAIQSLDERVSQLIGKGDQAITDLDTAKGWAK